MKLSPHGKVLDHQSDKWEFVENACGHGPCMVSPGGRLLKLREFTGNVWGNPGMDPADTKFFVDGANMLRDANKAEQDRLQNENSAT